MVGKNYLSSDFQPRVLYVVLVGGLIQYAGPSSQLILGITAAGTSMLTSFLLPVLFRGFGYENQVLHQHLSLSLLPNWNVKGATRLPCAWRRSLLGNGEHTVVPCEGRRQSPIFWK